MSALQANRNHNSWVIFMMPWMLLSSTANRRKQFIHMYRKKDSYSCRPKKFYIKLMSCLWFWLFRAETENSGRALKLCMTYWTAGPGFCKFGTV
jgi:hypothetical protein